MGAQEKLTEKVGRDAGGSCARVMDDDLALRENRLRLLNRFVAVFAHVADFGKMAKGAK